MYWDADNSAHQQYFMPINKTIRWILFLNRIFDFQSAAYSHDAICWQQQQRCDGKQKSLRVVFSSFFLEVLGVYLKMCHWTRKDNIIKCVRLRNVVIRNRFCLHLCDWWHQIQIYVQISFIFALFMHITLGQGF